MKNQAFGLLFCWAALSACNSDESFAPQGGTGIEFKTYVAPQGRGAAASQDQNANLQQNFGVFVYRNADGKATAADLPNSLYNEKVTFTPGNGFSYAGTIYWPATDKLGFYAYSPYHTDGVSTGISDFAPTAAATPGIPGFTFTVDTDTENQIDLLVAKNEGLSGGVVALPFLHALSKIEVQAHTTGVNYRVAITGVRVEGVNSRGIYRFVETGNPWSGQSVEAGYSGVLLFNGNSKPNGTGVEAAVILYTGNAGSYTNVTDPANALYLLPQSLGVNSRLLITYNIYNAQSGNLITPLESQVLTLNIGDEKATTTGLVKWEKSRRVIYRLNFVPKDSGAGSEVKFEATVTDWSLDLADLN